MASKQANSAQEKEQLLTDFLKHIDAKGSGNTVDIAKALGYDHQTIIGIVKSVQSAGNLINAEQKETTGVSITPEGEAFLKDGSYEARVFKAMPAGKTVTKDELQDLSGMDAKTFKIGFSKAAQFKWIKPGKEIEKLAEAIEDSAQKGLQAIVAGGTAENFGDLKKRKLILETKTKSLDITKGLEFSVTLEKKDADLTPEMLQDGSWTERKFKQFNYNALGVPPPMGCLHPLLKVREMYRQIFLQLGFEEMPTNQFVESSFWNFDALFQPQQHPARDAHDTFFLTEPKTSSTFPEDYLQRVKTMHESGGAGSQGYGYDWSREEASKNILRTHTTAVSARMLYKVAQQKPFKPCKFFSIDRVFRNETLDATHLAEFHQIEGVIADRNLSLADLIGTLNTFFSELGIGNLKFKPAYNPYTEPSMEIFSYLPGLKKDVEIGNSGMFRPEMLAPMGLPDDVVVIAWGLSLERPTMIKYGYDNIRDLVGPKVDLQMAKANPLCR